MKKYTTLALVMVSCLFSVSAQAWFMNCEKLDGSIDRKIMVGFTENGLLVNLEHQWLKDGILQGGVVYSSPTQVIIDWPLGVFSGNSKARGLVLTVYQRHTENVFVGTVTDYDFLEKSMSTYAVLCTLRQ